MTKGGVRRLPLRLAVLLAALAPAACAHAARDGIVREWDTVSADPAALDSLVSRTRAEAGPELLRTVLSVAADSTRPTAVRLHALTVVPSYLEPGNEWRLMEHLLDPDRTRFLGTSSHPDYRASTSIEPILRDTARVLVGALAESSGDSLVRLAARNLEHLIGPPLSERRARTDCRGPTPGEDLERWYRREAYVALRLCPEVTAELWAGVGPDSARIDALFRATQHLRDRRFPPALSSVASDDERPREIRWAALQALATLAHPRMYAMSPRSLETFDEGWCIRWSWHAHHAVQEEGPEPMGAEGRQVVLRILQRQAEQNPDAALRRGAAELARCVERLLAERPSPRR